jgi:hypothetical protein
VVLRRDDGGHVHAQGLRPGAPVRRLPLGA